MKIGETKTLPLEELWIEHIDRQKMLNIHIHFYNYCSKTVALSDKGMFKEVKDKSINK